jgi:hypothetical protein
VTYSYVEIIKKNKNSQYGFRSEYRKNNVQLMDAFGSSYVDEPKNVAIFSYKFLLLW